MAILDPSHPCECVDGMTPHIDPTTGNWFLGETDTGIHAQGEQGIQGMKGDTGEQGEPGVCKGDCDNGKMTICHVAESGQKQTLNLPLPAAIAHLREHPLDTVGSCPIE